MPTTVVDSLLFRDMFGTAAMRAVFSDQGLIRRYLEVEVALARAQAGLGLIPAAAAAAIAAHARFEALDLDRLRQRTERVGYPILPLVEQIVALCPDGLGEYVHWGATTQDIMDTALALQLRDALALVDAELAAIDGALERLARRHAATAMAGRTHLQHALPITFGYKAALWRDPLPRHRERLAAVLPRVAVLGFAGAAGTLASLGADGERVHAALAAELGLAPAPVPWHVVRDGVAEAVTVLALITGSLSKLATDVMLLMQTEVGEAFEPFAHGRGASSTMPQKRNPIGCELILATGRAVRQFALMMTDAMAHDHERATGPWHVEWIALPQAFVLASGALHHARAIAEGLEVDPDRMRRNLAMTHGLIVSEAVMMALAPAIGRQRAHDLVYDACRAAMESGRPLGEVLAGMDAVTAHLDRAAIERAVDPARYVGGAAAIAGGGGPADVG